jgi:hypothetical protein
MVSNKDIGFTLSRKRNHDLSITLRFASALCLASLVLMAPAAAQTVGDIFNFAYGAGIGSDPSAPLIASPNGALYGTTATGGDLNCPEGQGQGCGTVFELNFSGASWIHTTLYEFQGGKDGVQSVSTLTLDPAGRLYGVTNSGTPYGAIYRLTPGVSGEAWHFGLLYEFQGGSDGAYALSPLFLDKAGAIYGASQQGGLHGEGCNQQFGCGAIFQLVPPSQQGGAWTEQTLYDFAGASDGGNPSTMIMDSTGTIYGTTTSGGIFNSNCYLGCGVVFKLTPQNGSWNYSVIFRFKGAPDESAYGNLIRDSHGVLFGLAMRGLQGSTGGVVFRLAPGACETGPWTLQNIHEFRDTYPATNLQQGRNGVLYGDIYGDQDFNSGYVFQIEPPVEAAASWTYTNIVDFNSSTYQNPEGVLVTPDALYVTITGGGYSPGNIVSVTH